MNDGVIIGEQSNEFYTKDLPQLIVALDKEDNYIHIRDVKENVEYFCPCCRNSIKPRAFKTDIEYQVQPHFYHINGSCDEESRVHWIYKNWLFKEGSQFYIKDKLYMVKSVDIEKSYDAKFGKYRPDITVYTKCGKTIFFEINFTSAKKEDDYFAKWNELNIDVIEVNIKKLMNEDYDCKIPTFEIVYSDGECFKKSYAKKDEYSTIANIKREWKRQEKIDYKIMWQKLDWFWLTVQDFKHEKCNIDNVLESFEQINIKDKEICFDLIKKQSCIKKYNQKFRDVINEEMCQFGHMSKEGILEIFNINIIDLTKVRIRIELYLKDSIDVTLFGTYKGFEVEYVHCLELNKEWHLKFSNLLKCVERINKKVEQEKNRIDKLINFNQNTLPILLDFINGLKTKENCIWEFEISATSERVNIFINIKNREVWNGETVYLEISELSDYNSNDDIVIFIKEKMLSKMVYIHKRISKYDGICSNYRHMFIGGTKFDTNK